jgi:hypothetical protein
MCWGGGIAGLDCFVAKSAPRNDRGFGKTVPLNDIIIRVGWAHLPNIAGYDYRTEYATLIQNTENRGILWKIHC